MPTHRRKRGTVVERIKWNESPLAWRFLLHAWTIQFPEAASIKLKQLRGRRKRLVPLCRTATPTGTLSQREKVAGKDHDGPKSGPAKRSYPRRYVSSGADPELQKRRPTSRSSPPAVPRYASSVAATGWRGECPPSRPALCGSPKSPNFGACQPSNMSRPKTVSGNPAGWSSGRGGPNTDGERRWFAIGPSDCTQSVAPTRLPRTKAHPPSRQGGAYRRSPNYHACARTTPTGATLLAEITDAS